MSIGESVRLAYKPLRSGSNATVGFLTNSAATYYTAPASPDNAITHVFNIVLCNTDSAERSVRVHIVDNGASAAQSNAIAYNLVLPANSITKLCFGEGELLLTKNMTIQALASANSVVTMGLFGAEQAS